MYRTAIAFTLTIFLCSRMAFAVDPITVETSAATYRVSHLPDVRLPMAVSANGQFLVMPVANGQSQLGIYHIEFLEVAAQVVDVPNLGAWRLVENEVWVGTADGWVVYAIPSGEQVRTFSALQFGQESAEALTSTPVCGGWLANQVFYRLKDQGLEPLASFRSLRRKAQDLDESLSKQSAPEFHVVFRHGGIAFPGIDFLPVPQPPEVVSHFQQNGPGRRVGLMGNRNGNTIWITSTRNPSPSAIVVSAIAPPPKLDSLEEKPLEIIDRVFELDDLSPSKYSGDGPIAIQISPKIRPNGFFEYLQFVAENQLTTNAEAINAAFDQYLAKAIPEFETIVGRKANGFPIELQVTVSDRNSTLTHVVWTELSRDEILARYVGNDILEEIEEDVQARKEARFKRVATAQNKLAAAFARKARQSAAKQAEAEMSFFSRIGESALRTTLTVLATLGCIATGLMLFIMRKRQLQEAEEIKPRKMTTYWSILLALLLTPAVLGQEWGLADTKNTSRVRSIPLIGEVTDFKHDFFSGSVLIWATDEEQEVFHVYNLVFGRKQATGPVPENWNWDSTSVGTRYAVCRSEGNLLVLDLTTAKLVASKPLEMQADPHVFFGKALYAGPNHWYSFPGLSRVENHPIADPRWFQLASLGVPGAPPVQPDKDSLVVGGMRFDEKLAVQDGFSGRFKRDTPQSDLYDLSSMRLREKDDQLELVGSFYKLDPKMEREADKSEYTFRFIAPKRHKLTENQPVQLKRYEKGFFQVVQNHLITIALKPEYARFATGLGLDYRVPYLAWDGTHDKIKIRHMNDSIVLGAQFSHPQWPISTEFNYDSQEYEVWLRAGADLEKSIEDDPEMSADVLHRIRADTGLPPDAEWEAVVEEYLAYSQRWALPYSKALGHRFEGVPVEIPVMIPRGQGRASVVIDFPRSLLDKWSLRQDSRATPVPQSSKIVELVAAFKNRPPVQDVKSELENVENEEIPELEYPEPLEGSARINASDNLPIYLSLLTFPFAVLIRAGMLAGALRWFGQSSSSHESNLDFGDRKFIKIALVVIGWTCATYAVDYLFSLLFGSWLETDLIFWLGQFAALMILGFTSLVVLLTLATGEDVQTLAPVALGCYLVLLLISIPGLIRIALLSL